MTWQQAKKIRLLHNGGDVTPEQFYNVWQQPTMGKAIQRSENIAWVVYPQEYVTKLVEQAGDEIHLIRQISVSDRLPTCSQSLHMHMTIHYPPSGSQVCPFEPTTIHHTSTSFQAQGGCTWRHTHERHIRVAKIRKMKYCDQFLTCMDKTLQ